MYRDNQSMVQGRGDILTTRSIDDDGRAVDLYGSPAGSELYGRRLAVSCMGPLLVSSGLAVWAAAGSAFALCGQEAAGEQLDSYGRLAVICMGGWQ